MKIATWNINGGIRFTSINPKTFVDAPDIDYYLNQLEDVRPDILCLQEVHVGAKTSQVTFLAE